MVTSEGAISSVSFGTLGNTIYGTWLSVGFSNRASDLFILLGWLPDYGMVSRYYTRQLDVGADMRQNPSFAGSSDDG